MARFEHLDDLRRRLHAGDWITNQDVQNRLGVTERQARRVLVQLAAAGPSLVVRRQGRRKFYGYAPHHKQALARPVELSEDEALALAFAVEAARAALLPTPLADPLESAAAKLFAAADVLTFEPEDAPFLIRFSGTNALQLIPEVFRSVWTALSEGRRLTISYVNARGRRSWSRGVDPYALIVVGGSWTLVGFDHHLGHIAHFALPAVESAEVGEHHGGPPAGFDLGQHVRDAFGAFAPAGDVETVRIEVRPEAAASFLRKLYHPTQVVEEVQPDGALVVSFEVSLAPDLAAFLRSFGPAIRVVEPASLSAEVAADAESTAALYRE